MNNSTTGRPSILREDDPSTWDKAWDSDAQLRAEFGNEKGKFLASMRNADKGRLYGSREPRRPVGWAADDQGPTP